MASALMPKAKDEAPGDAGAGKGKRGKAEGEPTVSARIYLRTHKHLRKIASEMGKDTSTAEALDRLCGKAIEDEVLRIAQKDVTEISRRPKTAGP